LIVLADEPSNVPVEFKFVPAVNAFGTFTTAQFETVAEPLYDVPDNVVDTDSEFKLLPNDTPEIVEFAKDEFGIALNPSVTVPPEPIVIGEPLSMSIPSVPLNVIVLFPSAAFPALAPYVTENVLAVEPSNVPVDVIPVPPVSAFGTFNTERVFDDNCNVVVSATLLFSMVPSTEVA